jgi:hypothetical protein
MSEELTDIDPFKGEDKPDWISDPMVKKVTFLIHKLANRRGQDFKEIQKKCKVLFNYSNLAKVSMDQGHQIIKKLIQLTGGEEEEEVRPRVPQGARVTDDLSPQLPTEPTDMPKKRWPAKQEERPKKEKVDVVTATMRESIRAAVDITLKEVVEKKVPVQGLGGFVLEIGKVIFEAKMSEGVK